MHPMFRPALILGLLASVAVGQPFEYPKARKGDVVDDYFGTKVADPYRWLEDTDSPETTAWINSEVQTTSTYLDKLPDRAAFKERLTSLLKFERYTSPSWEGQRYIFRENTGLQNQSVIYTVKDLTDAPSVLLDPNQLSSDGTVSVSDVDASDDGKLVAYGVAASGSDWNEIRVRQIDSGRDLPDSVKWIKFSGPRWTNDSKGFFYARFPEPNASGNQKFAKLQNQKIYYHRIGDRQDQDQLIYETDNPAFTFDLFVSHDGRYLFMTVSNGTGPRNNVYFKDLGDPMAPKLDAPFQQISEQFVANFLFVGSIGSKAYLRTDVDAPKYKIIEVDLTNPRRDHWKDVVPESKDLLQNALLVGGKLAVNHLVDAKNLLSIYDLEGTKQTDISLPTLGTVTGLSGDQDRPELFYSFVSFLYPPTIYRYDVETGKSEVFKKPSIEIDADAFETKQIFFSSKDGTRIPMFIVHKKGLNLDGTNPLYLTAYGGFNVSLTPSFSPSYLSWIERGGVFALPNIRGGGEYGRDWHDAGTKERKQNVFDDFFAAAESVIREKYTSAGKIAIVGASNGGLLTGASLTQRPDLFGAVVAKVGVMDMLRFQKFTIGWTWASDYGSSDTADGFNTLIKYSPLQNIRKGVCYPPTLITTGDHDDRVVPGHSFKFAAALQAAQGCDKPVLIRIDTKSGHGGGKPISKLIDEESDILAFMWDETSVTHWSTSEQRPVGK
jgi:prolyl oligopeptidase